MHPFAHRILVRLVSIGGAMSGFALFYLAMLLAFGVIGLPAPGDQGPLNVVMALASIILFFVMTIGGGNLALGLLQRFWRGRCPDCGKCEIIFVARLLKRGQFRCRACGKEFR